MNKDKMTVSRSEVMELKQYLDRQIQFNQRMSAQLYDLANNPDFVDCKNELIGKSETHWGFVIELMGVYQRVDELFHGILEASGELNHEQN